MFDARLGADKKVSTKMRLERGLIGSFKQNTLQIATYWSRIILGMVIIDRLVIFLAFIEVDLLDAIWFN
jgi:hypothetical protein